MFIAGLKILVFSPFLVYCRYNNCTKDGSEIGKVFDTYRLTYKPHSNDANHARQRNAQKETANKPYENR